MRVRDMMSKNVAKVVQKVSEPGPTVPPAYGH
jgi:hypothetical protein